MIVKRLARRRRLARSSLFLSHAPASTRELNENAGQRTDDHPAAFQAQAQSTSSAISGVMAGVAKGLVRRDDFTRRQGSWILRER
jgi:hypothetical protein